MEGALVEGALEEGAVSADVGLLHRAVVAAGLSFTISDARRPDNPLIYVNPAFELATGYSRSEAEGRNCRFLQGPATDPDAVLRAREVIAAEEHATVTLLNYRKNGTTFWNELSLSPVHDADGQLTHVVGIQADVTGRVLGEQERSEHLAAERLARAGAERAQRQLALLAESSTVLAASLDVQQILMRLTRLVVPVLADWCTVHLAGDATRRPQVVAHHDDPAMAPLMRRIEQLQPGGLSAQSHTAAVLAGGAPLLLLVPEVGDAQIRRAVDDPELRQVYRAAGTGSAIIVPLRARRQVVGVLALYTADDRRTFDEHDLSLAADLARRAAVNVDNARLYERERYAAEQLQRSLLPALPQVAGLDRAARYLPGSTAAQVGGDWYDVIGLPDGAVGLAIGDVMGHDLVAAASMGQLRSVLRSYAWQGSGPAVVLDRLDQLVQGLAMAQLATCVYGRLELPVDGDDGRLTLANAGHLPPVLRSPDGEVRFLGGEPALLVGVAPGTAREQTVEAIAPGSLLVFCTDGLVEHRGRSLDDGLAALQDAVRTAPDADAEAVCDHLLAALTREELEDDVAVLVVRVL